MESLLLTMVIIWLVIDGLRRSRKDEEVQRELGELRRRLPEAPKPVARASEKTAEAVPEPVRVPIQAPAPPLRPEPPLPAPAPPPIQVPTPAPTPAAAPLQPGLPKVQKDTRVPVPEPAAPFDWESLVGVKLFSYIAGIALLVAAVAFLHYSIDHGWLNPAVRMSIGTLVGIALLVGCETKRAQVYAITAQSLSAGGIATLFSTFYAATALWHLLPSWVAFLLMALVTAVAVALSIRRDSVYIALLGLVGGFATPMLLSTGQDNPLGLFGYLALLNVGLAWVAYRKRWPLLTALTLGFTALYQVAWAGRFLEEAKLGTSLVIFLLFPVLAFGALILGRLQEPDRELPPLFRQATAFTAAPPLLFALYVGASPAYGHHYAMMFGFLFLVASGLAAIALFHGPEWLHTLGAGGVLALFSTWMVCSYNSEAWPAILAFTALFVALYLFVPWLQSRLKRKRPFQAEGRLAVFTAPLLLFVFPALVFLEPAVAEPWILFGALLALMALVACYAVRFEEGMLHFLACCFALIAEALWSHRFLDTHNLLAALLLYGGFALFFLGVPVWAERRGKSLRPLGSGALLAFTTLPVLLFLTAGPVAHFSLGILAVLLGLLNLGLVFEASRGRYAILSVLGMLCSWFLLAVWWTAAVAVATLLPALLVVAAFGLLVVGSRSWLKTQAQGQLAGTPDLLAPFLGLAGHLFLLWVVCQPHLAPSPWPWLGVLLVLDLALGLAAIQQRTEWVLMGAAVLTQLIFAAWAGLGFRGPVTGLVAPWAALGAALLGMGWHELGRRQQLAYEPIPAGKAVGSAHGRLPYRNGLHVWSAGLGLVGAQLVLAVLKNEDLVPVFGLHVLVHVMLALGLLALAWRSREQGWAVALAASVGLVLFSAWDATGATPAQAREVLALATPLYLLQLAYPLALGSAAREERMPFISAILASAVFFLVARPALMALGFGAEIGLLPVLQALVLVPHLMRLLALEPMGQRQLGRLALVAGGILALVTVAIPLQLDKEWITLGWALLGMALAWLYGRVPHSGLLTWAAGLFALVFIRLALNPAVLAYHPRSAVLVLNWYLYTYLVAAACCFGAARLLKGLDDRLPWGLPGLAKPLVVGGAVLLFLLLNIEIADSFSVGPALTFNLGSGGLAQDLSYTIGWTVYAILMLMAGIVARNRSTRLAAILLLTVTVLKAFLHDLHHLEGLYRVGSFVGLAMSLSLVAVILQKFALRRSEELP